MSSVREEGAGGSPVRDVPAAHEQDPDPLGGALEDREAGEDQEDLGEPEDLGLQRQLERVADLVEGLRDLDLDPTLVTNRVWPKVYEARLALEAAQRVVTKAQSSDWLWDGDVGSEP